MNNMSKERVLLIEYLDKKLTELSSLTCECQLDSKPSDRQKLWAKAFPLDWHWQMAEAQDSKAIKISVDEEKFLREYIIKAGMYKEEAKFILAGIKVLK